MRRSSQRSARGLVSGGREKGRGVARSRRGEEVIRESHDPRTQSSAGLAVKPQGFNWLSHGCWLAVHARRWVKDSATRRIFRVRSFRSKCHP